LQKSWQGPNLTTGQADVEALPQLSADVHPPIAKRLSWGSVDQYAFWRDDLRVFGLELRPSLQFGPSGIDAAIEAAVIVPIIELLHLRLGGRVYSFGNAIVLGATGGLTLGL